MSNNKKSLPLKTEIQSLRLKLKSSNYSAEEECQRLYTEIKRLHYAIAKLNQPRRHTKKLRHINNGNVFPIKTKPEVIPPDLYVSDYFHAKNEIASGKESYAASVPVQTDNDSQTLAMVISPEYNNSFEQRNSTIEQRFAIVEQRMKKRRRQWEEEKQKKKPWWKFW